MTKESECIRNLSEVHGEITLEVMQSVRLRQKGICRSTAFYLLKLFPIGDEYRLIIPRLLYMNSGVAQ